MSTMTELDSLVINRVENQEVYDNLVATGRINENELYFVEDDGGTEYVEDVRLNGLSVVENGVASLQIDKSTVGLGNVDNTSDLDKPISTATQQALDDKLGQDNILEGSNITIQKDGVNNVTISTPGYSAGNGLAEAWNTFSIKVCDTNWNADVGKSNNGFIEMTHTVDENGLHGHAIPFDTNIFEGTGYSNNVFSIKNGAITAEKIADGVIPDTSNFMTTSAANAVFAAKEHNHDDRYYTETEVDSILDGKANTLHNHIVANITDFNDAVEALIPEAPTELPSPEALTISLNGTSQGAYDGSAAKNINITAANVGAAATNHEHSAASITSGTLSTDRLPSIPDAKIAGVSASKISGVISSANLPSYVDDVLEYDSQSDFPPTGESGKIYIAKDTNTTYRWGGSDYVAIGSSLALGTTSSTAFRGDYGNIAYQHALAKGSAYSSGLYKITTNSEGHVTAATAVTKSDITALGIPAQDTNTTYTTMKGATASAAGTSGLVPAPAAGKNTSFLRGDGTWVIPTNTNTTYTLSKSGSTITLEGSDGSSTSVTDANTTYTLSSFGVTATAAELNYMDGVTSNVQTQLNGKAATSHTHNAASTTAAGFLPKLGGGTTNFLRADGTWAKPPDTNTTYSNMTGASTSAAGKAGLVPAPSAGAATRYLRSDGTWAVPPDTNTTYTLSSFGITATAAELNKLDGVTTTATQFNYLNTLTGNVQTQLNGKAASSHTHSYLPLSGGTLTGTLTARTITPSADSTYNIGTSTVRYRNIYADTFTGALSGNATTATRLATSRTFSLTGDVTGSATFNGSANCAISAQIAANAVTANEIAANAVGTSEIAANAVTLAKLGSDVGTVAVQTAEPTDTNVKLWIKI